MHPDWIGADSYIAFGGVMLGLCVVTIVCRVVYDKWKAQKRR